MRGVLLALLLSQRLLITSLIIIPYCQTACVYDLHRDYKLHLISNMTANSEFIIAYSQSLHDGCQSLLRASLLEKLHRLFDRRLCL